MAEPAGMNPARPLRLLFMGTPDFAAMALRRLLTGPDQVVAVVSQPDRPQGRGKKLLPTAVKEVARQYGVPLLQPTKIKTPEFLQELAAYQPDLIIVAAYGRILPAAILQLPRHGCWNIHGSLLPAHRGAAPIQRALLQGDQEVGVTIMQMDEGLDTGDILSQRSLVPEAQETSATLFPKIAALGAETLLETIALLKAGQLSPRPQDEALATLAPMLRKEDGQIDWQRSAHAIHCLIRALDPWPTAYSFLHGEKMQFFRPEVVYRDSHQLPGTVLSADTRGLLIATGENCLLVQEIQLAGKKRLSVTAFLCGHPLPAGSRFLSPAPPPA